MWIKRIVRLADKGLNCVIWCMILVLLLYSGLGLWDTYCIYIDAGNNTMVYQYKPSGEGENPTLLQLRELNSDVCAWLTVDDTKIDYPVVQGETNMEYINKAVDGSFSLPGSLFLDYRNDLEFQDFYSLIYGHHMAGDVMFGSLPYFQETAFFEQHVSAKLFLVDCTKKIEIFACVHTDAYDSILFHPKCNDADSRKMVLNQIRNKAVQYRDVEFGDGDRILGLSTCYDTTTNGRIIVFGKMKNI